MRAYISDEEFTALWRNMHLSARDVAGQLGIGLRAANKRAHGLGLRAKGIRQTKAQRLRGQLMEVVATGPVAGSRPAWSDDPRIGPLNKEFNERLLAVQTSEDLARLWALAVKLAMLLALYYPEAEAPWRDLANLAKQALVCRRIEVEMPPSANPAVLRQEAALQMMREVADVLSAEEQRLLGEMIQVASDRITARKKDKAAGAAAGGVLMVLEAPAERLPEVSGAPW